MGDLTGFRWAAGWITADALMASEEYDLGMFPRQADQVPGRDWMRPSNESDLVNDSAEIVVGTNGFSAGYGNPNISWKLRALTPLMVRYVKASRFPGGVWTCPATICIPALRSSGSATFYQALATRSQFNEAELALGGLDNWSIVFTNAVEIEPAGSLLNKSSFALLTEDGDFMLLEA